MNIPRKAVAFLIQIYSFLKSCLQFILLFFVFLKQFIGRTSQFQLVFILTGKSVESVRYGGIEIAFSFISFFFSLFLFLFQIKQNIPDKIGIGIFKVTLLQKR